MVKNINVFEDLNVLKIDSEKGFSKKLLGLHPDLNFTFP